MAHVKTQVTLTLVVDVGNFGDEWTVGSLNKDAKRALDTALGHLKATAFKSGMHISNVENKGLLVMFEGNE